MFSRKKPEPPKRRNHDLSQFGLTEIPDDFDPTAGYGDDDNDSDLEAELAALSKGSGKPRAKPKSKANLVSATDLDKMIADSMKDVGSDDDDEDVDDPDLLGELQTITGDGDGEDEIPEQSESSPPSEPNDTAAQQMFLPTTTMDTASIIRQRIEMYKQAEDNAKTTGESAKARRFGRGLKTLNDLLKQATAGKTINVDDIPPEVIVKPVSKPSDDETTPPADELPKVPSRAAPPPPPPVADPAPTESTETTKMEPGPAKVENAIIIQMRERQRDYKKAALQANRSGDKANAIQFLKVVKQFDIVIKMCEDGQEVDLSDMPPPPEEFLEFLAKMQAAEQTPTAPDTTPAPTPSEPIQSPPALEEPTSVLEALQQRLEKYKSVEGAAKAEGNSSKARRFGRIVKQYEEAIKNFKAGREVAYDELPVPPGFGPLPIENATKTIPSAPTAKPESVSSSSTPTPSSTATPTSPATTPIPATKKQSPRQEDLTTRTSGNQQKNNLAEQQMKILLERQKEFKMAAIEAKKAGEIEQAKEYVKLYKGFDALLNAASSGLPVDLNTLPLPPSQRENLESSFAIISTDDCNPDDDISDIGVRVEEQLAKQLMMCKNTRDHHKAMGDVAGMNRFENLAITVQKDLDLVRHSKRLNRPLPKFHYEQRSFNIVHCNTDLTDNELEIVVVRGINYNVQNPKDVDTYVKIEFPLLNDETFKTKTSLVKDNDSPDYDQRFKVEIQRGNRQFQRIFKRHGVKLEVYSRGCSLDCCGLSRILPICCFSGFLRSDVLIGTVNVKLQPLETKCDIHDTFDLMDGRRPAGGKMEVKIRVRNPILTKQMEHINEKWLVLEAV